MSVEETGQVLNDYATALLGGGDFGQYMAENVVVSFMEVDQQVSGRQMAVDGIIALHTMQFDARPEILATMVGEGIAALEIMFVGTHTDEFGGIPATDMAVNVPYVVFYSLADGLITELRIYGLAAGLMQQLTGADITLPRSPEPY
jgi:predicted ester cyclase